MLQRILERKQAGPLCEAEAIDQAIDAAKAAIGGGETQATIGGEVYSLRKDKLQDQWDFNILRQGRVVASLLTMPVRDGRPLRAAVVGVSKNLQGRGLATFLYAWASLSLGAPFEPSAFQTADGRALWRKLRQMFP